MRRRVLRCMLVCLMVGGRMVTAQVVGVWTGGIRGTVVDGTGAAIIGATVGAVSGSEAQTTTGAGGAFALHGVGSGEVTLTAAAPGFGKVTRVVAVSAGEMVELGQVTLAPLGVSSSVQVTASRQEVAVEQVREEETQRLLGVIPNFLVTYRADAVPLSAKQKLGLTSRFTLDVSSFVIAGAIAGIEQADDAYVGYGQGAQGYGKRYGAAYADFAIGNVLGSAVLPVLFKQDPRYFVKGTGTVRARLLYAIANSVVRKGDNGRWQPDYSSFVGDLGAAAISNLYYPAGDRSGAGTILEKTAIGVAGSAAANVLQEFVLRKLTPKARKHGATTP